MSAKYCCLAAIALRYCYQLMAARPLSVSRTGMYTHLHVHLEDAEAVGEGAAAREAARRQCDPPRPPAARALRHEGGLPAAHQTSGGRGGS